MEGLVTSGVVVRFGGLLAVDGVDIAAPPGEITGLIGPNGAGKTTLFNVICGFQPANEGCVLLDDVDLTGLVPAQRARMGLGRTFQRMELFHTLTVWENVALAAESTHIGTDPLSELGVTRGGRRVSREVTNVTRDILDLTGLTPLAQHVAGELATGHGRLLELARALARNPRILLLDEPSSGLDVNESKAFGRLLVSLVAQRDLGILMIEHDMNLVLEICDRIYVLDFGRLLMTGSPHDVRASEVVRAAYLGRAAIA